MINVDAAKERNRINNQFDWCLATLSRVSFFKNCPSYSDVQQYLDEQERGSFKRFKTKSKGVMKVWIKFFTWLTKHWTHLMLTLIKPIFSISQQENQQMWNSLRFFYQSIRPVARWDKSLMKNVGKCQSVLRNESIVTNFIHFNWMSKENDIKQGPQSCCSMYDQRNVWKCSEAILGK